LGCGKSIPKNKKDKSYWNVNYFTKELAQVVDHFNFKEFILIGHSWGAVPIVEYASNKKFKNNTKLKAVVLASPYIDSTIWKQDVIKLVQTLPGSKKNLLHKVIKNSNYNVRDFDKAIEIYSDYFMWNHYRKPKYFQQADKTFNEEMYEYMWGKSEFVVEGTLKNYSCVNRIKLIKAKSLFICGEFDEATPESTKNFSEKAKHGSYVEIKDSAHLFVTTHAKKFYKIFFDFIYSSNNG
jgi:proline iminopeptidase